MLTLEEFTRFAECLPDAVSRAKAGYHFEESGCWGLAAALREHFLARGGEVTLRYCHAGEMHVWVEVLDRPCDYTGEMLGDTECIRSRGTTLADEPAVLAACLANGIPKDQFFADKDWARRVIAVAVISMHWPLEAGQSYSG